MEQSKLQNQSVINDFVLLGLADFPQLRIPLFTLLLIIYILTLFGNVVIFVIIIIDSHLHTPMYAFLCNLAFLEICYISVTVPKMLSSLVIENQSISFQCCLMQIYFLHVFGGLECFLLAFMAYDRFVAICYPLRYATLMSQTVCLGMTGISWIVAVMNSTLNTVLTSQLRFCGFKEVLNFFCDVPPLLVISCSETTMNEIILKSVGGIVGASTALIIAISYLYIITTLLSIKADAGKWKPFSTCSSHLIVVTLFYGTGTLTYVVNGARFSLGQGSTISLCYSVLTPCLNPVIYSLRNKEIKASVRKCVRTIGLLHT